MYSAIALRLLCVQDSNLACHDLSRALDLLSYLAELSLQRMSAAPMEEAAPFKERYL